MHEFELFTKAELEQKRIELKELLDEVTEERAIILGQENLHLPGNLVVKYENELTEIRENIAFVEKLLTERLRNK